MLRRLITEEEGQGMTEYALIIALISIAAVAVMITFRDQIRNTFQKVTNSMQNT